MSHADEWETATELGQMAGLLEDADRAAGGYARPDLPERNAASLFVAGLCRDLWPLLVDARCRRAVEETELLLTGQDVSGNLNAILHAHLGPEQPGAGPETAQEYAAEVARLLWSHTWLDFDAGPVFARNFAIEAVRRSPRTPKGADYLRPFNGTDAVLCGRLRCLLGNPFRPTSFHPDWRTTAVADIAAGILASRDWGRLPVLADALDDAGCDDADLLAHARGSGPHLFGCRVVTACLGHTAR